VRLYDRLFVNEVPEEAPAGKTFLDNINPNSVQVIQAKVEPSLLTQSMGARVQFERNGYYCVDTKDSQPGKPVFNRTVTLKDTWAKIAAKG
jgi:glutaminyl-tRNA synthetase